KQSAPMSLSPEVAPMPVNGSSDGYGSDSDAGSSDLLLDNCQLPEHFVRLSKLRQEGVFCNVQVSVSGRDFLAHRCILGAASPYFLRLLLADPNCGHFALPRGYSPDAFALLLEFSYTGRLMVPDRLLPQVCSLASLLAMRPVLDVCSGRLLQTCLLPRTALELRAQLTDCQPVLDSIDAYIAANLAEVLSFGAACLPKIMLDLLVCGIGGVGLNQLCDLLADWLARSVHDASTSVADAAASASAAVAAKASSSPRGTSMDTPGRPGDSSRCDAMVDLDCLERMSSQPHLLYLTPGNVLIDCDDLASTNSTNSLGSAPDRDLAKSVPQIRDYIDSKRLQARVLSSRHRGPSPLSRSVLGVLAPPSCNADSGSVDSAVDSDASSSDQAAATQCLVRVGSTLALLSVRLLPVLPPEDAAGGLGGGFQRQLSVQSSSGGCVSAGYQRQMSGQSSAGGVGVGASSESDTGGDTAINGSPPSVSPLLAAPALGDSGVALAAMSTPRSAFGFVGFNDGDSGENFYLLACGGYNRGQCLSSAEILRPGWGGGCWTPAPPLLTARSRCSAAVLCVGSDSRVYVCGGSDGNCELSTVEIFDGNQWLAGPPMQQARSGCCAVAMDGVLYCLGGRYGADSLRQAEMLDPRVGRWQPLPPMLAWRNECAAAASNGQLWVAGGADNWGGQCLASVEVYEPRADRWIRAPRQLSQPRRGAAMSELAGRLWLVGGSDGQRPALVACEPVPVMPLGDETPTMSTVETSELATPALQLAMPRANLGLAALPASISAGFGRPPCLLAVGGFSGKVFLDCCELLHL
ncbi:hypothetical protein BOX15_Mlig000336g4, partial [Macrostomum lignano]